MTLKIFKPFKKKIIKTCVYLLRSAIKIKYQLYNQRNIENEWKKRLKYFSKSVRVNNAKGKFDNNNFNILLQNIDKKNLNISALIKLYKSLKLSINCSFINIEFENFCSDCTKNNTLLILKNEKELNSMLRDSKFDFSLNNLFVYYDYPCKDNCFYKYKKYKSKTYTIFYSNVNLASFISNINIVYTYDSVSALDALIYGKSVISFANPFYKILCDNNPQQKSGIDVPKYMECMFYYSLSKLDNVFKKSGNGSDCDLISYYYYIVANRFNSFYRYAKYNSKKILNYSNFCQDFFPLFFKLSKPGNKFDLEYFKNRFYIEYNNVDAYYAKFFLVYKSYSRLSNYLNSMQILNIYKTTSFYDQIYADVQNHKSNNFVYFSLDIEESKLSSKELFRLLKKSINNRNFDKCMGLIRWLFIAGETHPEINDILSEIALLKFDFNSSSYILYFSCHEWNNWKSGYFNWRSSLLEAMLDKPASCINQMMKACLQNPGSINKLQQVMPVVKNEYGDLNFVDSLLDNNLLPNKNNIVYEFKQLNSMIRKGNFVNAYRYINKLKYLRYIFKKRYNVLLATITGHMNQWDKYKKTVKSLLKSKLNLNDINTILKIAIFSNDVTTCKRLQKYIKRKKLKYYSPNKRFLYNTIGDIKEGHNFDTREDILCLKSSLSKSSKLQTTIEDFVSGSGNNLLLLASLGPGDEIRFASLYPYIIKRCSSHNLSITCDPKLYSLLCRTFVDTNFIPCNRNRNALFKKENYDNLPSADLQIVTDNTGWNEIINSDRIMLMQDIIYDYIDSYETTFFNSKYLVTDKVKSDEWKKRLSVYTDIKVGICWRSTLRTAVRDQEYLTIEQLLPVLKLEGFNFFNLQYDDCFSELDTVNRSGKTLLHNFEDLDQMNDLDSTAALIKNLDVVVSANTTVCLLASALGVPTIIINPTTNNKYWGRNNLINGDYWFTNTIYVSGNSAGDIEGVIKNLISYLEKLKDNEISKVINNAENVLKLNQPDNEADFLDYYKNLKKVINDFEKLPLFNSSEWAVFASLLEKVDDWHKASLCWKQAIVTGKKADSLLIQSYLNLLIHDGNVYAANNIIQNYSHILDTRSSEFNRLNGILDDKKYKLELSKILQQCLDVFKDDIGSVKTDYLPVIKDLMLLNGYEKEILELVENLFDYCIKFYTNNRYEERKIIKNKNLESNYLKIIKIKNRIGCAKKNRPVFCCGYSWSGSGAVADYLKQSDKIKVFGKHDADNLHFSEESTVFRHWYGISYLLDRNINYLTPIDVMEFVLGSVLGALIHPTQLYRIDVWKDRSLYSIYKGNGKFDIFYKITNHFISNLASKNYSKFRKSLYKNIVVLANDIVELFNIDETLILFNNSILATQIRLLSLFYDFKAILVKRDPRDQYVSQYYEWNWDKKPDLNKFIKKLKSANIRINRIMNNKYISRNVLLINFEDFVLKEKTRFKVLDFCGINKSDIRCNELFFPDKSKKNIGIYLKFPKQEYIKQIEDNFVQNKNK